MSLDLLHTIAANVVFYGIFACAMAYACWLFIGQYVRGEMADLEVRRDE